MTLKQKGFLGMMLWVLVLLGTSNTNNNPNSFVTRIFPPVKSGNSTFYYSGLIGLVLLYAAYKIMKKNWENIYPVLSKRIGIIVILSIFIMSGLCEYVVMGYKSFSNGLNGIYCYHNNKELSIYTRENNKIEAMCKLELKNCTYKSQEFYIEIDVPDYIRNQIEDSKLVAVDEGTNEIKKFVIRPKETAFIIAVFSGRTKAGITGLETKTKNFQFRLWNNKQTVEFKAKSGLTD